jgi:predicted enzyme related to lactoylglutathione lyase
MARIYREHPDSSYLTAPRILARVFCKPGQLVATVRFYEQLTGTRLDMDADIPQAGLHVVAVGSFLVLELDAEQHGLAAETAVTVLNADLDKAVARQVAAGAEIVQERWESPVGPGARLRHPDGLIVEYVEHRPGGEDASTPGPEFGSRAVP